MKIIVPGVGVSKPDFWLFRVPLTCPTCTTVFQLEPGDAYTQERPPDGLITVTCPGCDRPMQYYPSTVIGGAMRPIGDALQRRWSETARLEESH